MLDLEPVGVVIVMEETVLSELARLALRNGWSLIHLATADEVQRTIGRQRVSVAVIYVAVELVQAAELIQWLRVAHPDSLVVAATSTHSQQIEQQIRLAGAHCYLPDVREPYLENSLQQMLEQHAAPIGTGAAPCEPHRRKMKETSVVNRNTRQPQNSPFSPQTGLSRPTSDRSV